MGMESIFKYLGLAMEAANQAAIVVARVKEVKDVDSPGGKEITTEEMAQLLSSLDGNFSGVITRICQEAKLPVKSVTVSIEV